MAGLKEIKRRVKSVKNTRKITYAMKLVSAAKLRKAQESVTRSREYTNALNGLLAQLSRETGGAAMAHPLMERRETVRRIRLVVVGGSRGLCGGYNSNINKLTEAATRELKAQHPGVEIDAVLVGRKPAEYFRRFQRPYVEAFEQLGEDANAWPIEEIAHKLETAFVSGEVDEVHLIYTRFRSAISVSPQREKILPLDAAAATGVVGDAGGAGEGITLFEPAPVEVFSAIIPRILRSKIRQAALDAKASEHGSRMTAMDAATKNAVELSYSLQLKANKLRQNRITSELLDIVGGAEAIS